MLLYPDIFNYLMFYPAELGSKDLSDYKNCKAYSYYKSGWLKPLVYHDLTGSNFCILKGECRKSQSINNPFHKFWIILEKSSKIRSCHCTCMAGMSETCNHVAAAMFRVEAAVRNGLTNPACTSTANEWLPNRKQVEPSRIKNLSFNRHDFAHRGKTKRPLVATPKKLYNPLENCKKKPLQLTDFANALKDVAPKSILFTAVPKPKIDFVREIITKTVKQPENIKSINEILNMSNSIDEFKINVAKFMIKDSLNNIEIITRGQSENEQWYLFRKGVITASKAHEVITKMNKLEKGGGVHINMWSLNQKISGLTFVNPNIPALKYGRDMEIDAVNTFTGLMKKTHKNFATSECGLYLDTSIPFIGASSDRIVSCDCCGFACLEVKCPYSINFTKPSEKNLNYLTTDGERVVLKTTHKYYTQCMLQMGVTDIKKLFFVVWTSHGMVIEEINFDSDMFSHMKTKFKKYYEEFYLQSFFSKY